MTERKTLSINGRDYAWPQQPLVVVCIDGSQPEYIEQAIQGGHMPFTKEMIVRGADLRGRCVVPSFTNPNNISIVTGAPPNVHGISGNYFLDPDTGEEVMMNDPKFLRADTIFKTFHDAGAKVAVVTAKDKLRSLLGHGINFNTGRAVCFSSEKADTTSVLTHGIDNAQAMVGRDIPEVYSAELSEFVFDAGVKLLDSMAPDLMYLSTTDYIQHKHAPGTATANQFYGMMDGYLAQLDAKGALLAITADHGMNPKFNESGEPNVIYLQTFLDENLGKDTSRVILPITDPYVVHHGAFGSFATAYLPKGTEASKIANDIASIDGIEAAYTNAVGCEMFDLPTDRMGDIIVVSTTNKVIGTSPDKHDLSQLEEPLRSHGGVCDQQIPMLLNKPVNSLPKGYEIRNFDVFSIALNHTITS